MDAKIGELHIQFPFFMLFLEFLHGCIISEIWYNVIWIMSVDINKKGYGHKMFIVFGRGDRETERGQTVTENYEKQEEKRKL